MPGSGPAPTLADLLALVDRWPQLREVHASASASAPTYRLQHAATSLAACSRAEFTAALLASRSRRTCSCASDDVGLCIVITCGALRHEAVSLLLAGGLGLLAAEWRMAPAAAARVDAALRSVVGPPARFWEATLPELHVDVATQPSPCPLVADIFGAALLAGWPWSFALRLFTELRAGWPCARGAFLRP